MSERERESKDWLFGTGRIFDVSTSKKALEIWNTIIANEMKWNMQTVARTPQEDIVEFLKGRGPYTFIEIRHSPSIEIFRCDICGVEVTACVALTGKEGVEVRVCLLGTCGATLMDQFRWNKVVFDAVAMKGVGQIDELSSHDRDNENLIMRVRSVLQQAEVLGTQVAGIVHGIVSWFSKRGVLSEKQKTVLTHFLVEAEKQGVNLKCLKDKDL